MGNAGEKKNGFLLPGSGGIANQDTLFRYGVADIGYCEEAGYQLVLYNRHQQYPRQWFINEKMTEIMEMTR